MSLKFGKGMGKLSKPIIATLTAGYLLTGCGGGGGGGSKTTTGGNISSGEKYIGYVQAGYVKAAKVYVEGPNGEILYQTTTNENGEYEIDKEKLETKLKDYGYDMSTVLKIYTEGGIDTDTNDDGIKGDESAVKATLSAILQYLDINNTRITPISTLVTSYLLEVLNQQPTIDKLDEVSKKLGFSDYNQILHYDMVKQDSYIEKKLREKGFIDYLHKLYFFKLRK